VTAEGAAIPPNFTEIVEAAATFLLKDLVLGLQPLFLNTVLGPWARGGPAFGWTWMASAWSLKFGLVLRGVSRPPEPSGMPPASWGASGKACPRLLGDSEGRELPEEPSQTLKHHFA
jgi:hypothetical protein